MIQTRHSGSAFRQFLISAVLFFIVTVPFRHFFALMPVTEVRPASALPPFFGLIFGFWGALGAAAGNLAADIQSGYPVMLCLTGFAAQFLYGYVPWLLWYGLPLREEPGRVSGAPGGMLEEPGKMPEAPRMDRTAHVLKYLLIILADSCMMAVLLGLLMQFFHISALWSVTTLVLFLNNFDFCILLGIPLLILRSVRKNRKFSLNERVILVFLTLGLMAAFLTGAFSYLEAVKTGQAALAVWNRVYAYVAVSLNLFFLATLLFLWYMERNVTVPVEELSEAAGSYVREKRGDEAGDHRELIGRCEPLCQGSSEVGNLARSFVGMMTDLDTYMEHLKRVTAEKERIGAELSVATRIQASMLPCLFPAFPERKEFDIYATMQPAKEVGGDFYDFFLIGENRLAVVMADVSGKGVPAALFMVIAKTLIKNHAQAGEGPAEVFTNVNRQLCESNDAGMFVTAWIGILEIDTGRFSYANAGHNPPLLMRAGQPFEYLRGRAGFVLAGMEEIRYREAELTFAPGDMLYLYTDGVTEATSSKLELYGEERLLGTLNRLSCEPLSGILTGVKEDIDRFVDGAEQFDDITMLILKIRGGNDNE